MKKALKHMLEGLAWLLPVVGPLLERTRYRKHYRLSTKVVKALQAYRDAIADGEQTMQERDMVMFYLGQAYDEYLGLTGQASTAEVSR